MEQLKFFIKIITIIYVKRSIIYVFIIVMRVQEDRVVLVRRPAGCWP